MHFASELKDALFVNWALPLAALPTPPAPLTLDTLRRGDAEVGFVTLALFHQSGLRRVGTPWPALTFPQANLRLLVRDEERVASILFLRQLVPAWMVPIARLFGKQPASAAVFESTGEKGGVLRWRFQAGRELDLIAKPGGTRIEPLVPGGWAENVAFFRERPRGYVEKDGALRRLQAAHPATDAVPMRVEIGCADWLATRLPEVDHSAWAEVHSSFLIPSIQLSVAVDPVGEREAVRAVPAASRAATT